MAFYAVSVYLFGFVSFRASVGLVVRRLWSVVVSCVRSGSPGAVSVLDVLRGSCVDLWQRFRLAWRRISSAMGFYFVSWVLLHLRRLSSFCGPLDALPLLGLVSLYEFGLLLGLVIV